MSDCLNLLIIVPEGCCIFLSGNLRKGTLILMCFPGIRQFNKPKNKSSRCFLLLFHTGLECVSCSILCAACSSYIIGIFVCVANVGILTFSGKVLYVSELYFNKQQALHLARTISLFYKGSLYISVIRQEVRRIF